MPHMLGIISGTINRDMRSFDHLKERGMENEFGKAIVFVSHSLAIIPRHGRDPRNYILPHLINYQANMKALKDLGVEKVIAVNSTGSLKRRLRPGMLVAPDDFILLFGGPTIFRAESVHITPTISEKVRQELLQSARECDVDVVDGGIYWQTMGPRLETRAEIAMMAKFADIVGMTMASEAVIAKELGMSYASLCSVDNYAHGLGDKELSMKEISRHARKNAELVMRIIDKYIKRF